MKQLKSSGEDLRELFDQNITMRHIAEPLTSFDADHPASAVRLFMEERDYDVVGVRHTGLVSAYVKRADLDDGTLSDHICEFAPSNCLPDTTPLIDVFEALRDSSHVFVLLLGQVGGIVTRGDLQKAPVRMWLFGLVSLIEMQLLRMIREDYPNDGWQSLLSDGRLAKAKDYHKDRRRRNEAIDLADCLQFADKRDIVLATVDLRSKAGLEPKESGERLLKDLEKLRDNLAHAQDIVTGYWPKLVDLTKDAEVLLRQCEVAVIVPSVAP
jgi:hypothetical protein